MEAKNLAPLADRTRQGPRSFAHPAFGDAENPRELYWGKQGVHCSAGLRGFGGALAAVRLKVGGQRLVDYVRPEATRES